MGSRYYITEVQLRMLIAMDYRKSRQELSEEIIDNQYLGEKDSIDIDVDKKVIKELEPKIPFEKSLEEKPSDKWEK